MSSSPSHMKNKKVVLITGGNKGIGKATCKTLLQQHPGIHVLLGSRDVEKGRQAASDITAHSKSFFDSSCITVVQLDVTSDSSVQAAAKLVTSFGCKLYGIVNNAGVSENTSATSRDIFNTNYFGPRRVNNAFAPLLVKPGGRIVNISSVTAPIYLSSCLFSFGPKGKRRDLHNKLANPCCIEGGVKELDNFAANGEALNLCKPTLGRTLAVPVVLPKAHAYMLSKAFLNAYTVLHSKEEPDLVVNSCCPGFIGTDLNPRLGAAARTADHGANMSVELLMANAFKSGNDGKFYAEAKQRSLSEIPCLQFYPKQLAFIFEKSRN